MWGSWEKDVCISFGFKLVRKFGAAPVQWPATGLILRGTEPQILERVFSPLPNYLEFLEIYMILKPRRTADHMFRLVVPTWDVPDNVARICVCGPLLRYACVGRARSGIGRDDRI